MQTPDDLKVPKPYQRFFRWFYLVWIAIFIMRFWSLSFFDWTVFLSAERVVEAEADSSGKTWALYRYVSAWLEYAFLIIAMLLIGMLGYVFALCRDVVRFMRFGRKGLYLSVMDHAIYVLVPSALTHFVYMVISGASFEGTRAEGMPLPVLLGMCGIIAPMTTILTLAHVFDPERSTRRSAWMRASRRER